MKSVRIQFRARRGSVIAYSLIGMSVLFAFAAFSVDLGRLQLIKSQAQVAADAIAIHAARGLSESVQETIDRATAAAADNKIDRATFNFNTTTDLEFGAWEPTTRTFTVLTGNDRRSATAVRVSIRKTAARSQGVATTLLKYLGRPTVDITRQAIATRGKIVQPVIDADSAPWLAGMPNGTVLPKYGGNPTNSTAPNQSPYQVTELPVVPGQKLYFRKTEGTTSYEGAGDYTAEGNTGWIVEQQSSNGINSTKAPLNSLVGIFLNGNAPNSTSAASSLDFSSNGSRNFSSLSPGLKQVFFIGDGMDNAGDLQEFVVPAGATRFYLGFMDEKAWWWDNTGTIETTLMDGNVQLVK